MARQIRKKSGTGIYHIMLRGIPLMIQSLEKVRRIVNHGVGSTDHFLR